MKWLAPNLLYLTRADWGAGTGIPRLGGPEHPGRNFRLIGRDERTRVIKHHTAGIDPDRTPNVVESLDEVKYRMRRLQTIRPDLGLDVPYSFVAFLMRRPSQPALLVICEGRGYDRSGAHTLGGYNANGQHTVAAALIHDYHNVGGIAVAFAGDFENYAIDISPWLPMISRFDWHLRHEAGMVNLGSIRPLTREVFVHLDYSQTSCPGWHIASRAGEIEFIAKGDEDMPDEELRNAMWVAGLFASAASSLEQGLGLPDPEKAELRGLLISTGATSDLHDVIISMRDAPAIMRYGEARAQQRRPLHSLVSDRMLWMLDNWL